MRTAEQIEHDNRTRPLRLRIAREAVEHQLAKKRPNEALLRALLKTEQSILSERISE